MRPIYAGAAGLWSPGFAGVEAWRSRRADPEVKLPPSALLPPVLRRRSSLLTRMAAEALAQAAEAGGAAIGGVPTVWASAYGEIETTIGMLEAMLEPDGLPSPTRFHNSVHNTAAGSASIGAGNRAFSTSLAAGPHTVAMGLLETCALLEQRGGEAVLIAFDEPPPAPFAPEPAWSALAVAFHLSAERGPSSRVELSAPRREDAPIVPIAGPYSGHPILPALRLLEALLGGEEIIVPLGLRSEGGWATRVRPLRES